MARAWEKTDLDLAVAILAKHNAPGQAIEEIAGALERALCYDLLHDAFNRHGYGPPGKYCAKDPALDGASVGVVLPPSSGLSFAVISDLHFGSKYCLRASIVAFVRQVYDRGVRLVVMPGDILDGCYAHGTWEVSHSGFDAQADDAFDTLPRLPGLSYVFIDGNHDETFSARIGMESGRCLEERFKARGRDDLRFLGSRGATVQLLYSEGRPALRVELWHPRGSASNPWGRLRNKINEYTPGNQPDVLLAGHWHSFVSFSHRGVYALSCGTFQGCGSSFSKSLAGAAAIGGQVLSWFDNGEASHRFAVDRIDYQEAADDRVVVIK